MVACYTMSDVQFSEEEGLKAPLYRHGASGGGGGGLQRLPIRLGLAKDETGATIILIVIGLFAVVLAVILFSVS